MVKSNKQKANKDKVVIENNDKTDTVRDKKKKDLKELKSKKNKANNINETKLNNKNNKQSTDKNFNNENTIENNNELIDKTDEDITNIKEIYELKLKEINNKLSLNKELLLNAVKCLKQILTKNYENETNVFKRKDEENLLINFTFSNLPLTYSLRPNIIPIKINNKSKRKACLIIRDPVESWNKLNISFDNNKDLTVDIIPMSELKLEYERFENKRNLLKRFDVFLCDNHIYHNLKKLLGRDFYDEKKYPIGITINYNSKDDKELALSSLNAKNEIIKASTHYLFYMSNGPNYTVKAGFVEDDNEELINNIIIASKHTLANILKWGVEYEHLKSITIKCNDSLELPIFNQLTEEEIKAGKELINKTKETKITKDNKNSKKSKKN